VSLSLSLLSLSLSLLLGCRCRSAAVGAEDLLVSHNTVARLCAGRALPSSATTTVTAAATATAAGAQIKREGAGLAAVAGQGAFGDGSGLEPPCFLVLGVLGAAAAHRPPGPNPSPGPDGYQKVTPVLYPAIERQRTTHSLTCLFLTSLLPSQSVFTVLAAAASAATPLAAHLPAHATLPAGGTALYTFSFAPPAPDLVLALTPLYGDPDLYVSLAPKGFPSVMNYTWVAAAYGADAITLQAGTLPLVLRDISLPTPLLSHPYHTSIPCLRHCTW